MLRKAAYSFSSQRCSVNWVNFKILQTGTVAGEKKIDEKWQIYPSDAVQCHHQPEQCYDHAPHCQALDADHLFFKGWG